MTADLPWTPESVRTVAEALYGPIWQARLAEAISEAGPIRFPSVRVRHWYLEKNHRPIPHWLQPLLTQIFMNALVAHDKARAIAIGELKLRRGATYWPDDLMV